MASSREFGTHAKGCYLHVDNVCEKEPPHWLANAYFLQIVMYFTTLIERDWGQFYTIASLVESSTDFANLINAHF